jgi:hypothetical protein
MTTNRSRKETAGTVAPEQDDKPAPAPIAPEKDTAADDDTEPSGTVGLLNPGGSTVVYTEDGRSLGGGERARVEEIDPVGRAAIARGYLVETD